ncbi:MAG: superoxide dismutase, Fe-Mn family [Gaiellaceae bacterium]|nr:superoxide dismutase, Fe-Mn family [Gaiellaceae bacterium]
MPIPAGTHTFGPENGALSVKTGRTGAAAMAGHDLLLYVTAWRATLEVAEGFAATSLLLDADATSLRVQEGTGGMQPLGGPDKASIQETIDDEVLKREGIAFRSTAVETSPDGSRIGVRGELTLVGKVAPVAFQLSVGPDGSLSGSAVVRQSDWGITPYSTLFGALKVADEVEVAVDLSLQPRAETTMRGYEAIRPRDLKPALLELDGISRASVEAHHRLYRGYVSKRGEILRRLASVDLGSANQVSSELRALKVELSFAIGGIKNHEVYFEHLGGGGGGPTGAIAELIARDFGSAQAWRDDLRATALAGRGWAWTAYDWDEGRLFNSIGDGQNTFSTWNTTPLIALDVHEHAYFLDFQTDRGAYIEAFFANLDWSVVNGWVESYGISQSL